MKYIFLTCLLSACFISGLSQTSQRLLVPYRLGNKWGYSDVSGKIKIPTKYDSVTFFDYDREENKYAIAIVILNGKEMVINEMGSIVVPAFDRISIIEELDETAFYIFKDNKIGVFSKGKEIIAPIYDYIEITPYAQYKPGRNNKLGLFNHNGKALISADHDVIRQVNSDQPGFNKWLAIKDGKEEFYSFKSEKPQPRNDDPPLEMVAIESSEATTDNSIEGIKRKYAIDSVESQGFSAIVYKNGKQGILLNEEGKIFFFSRIYDIQKLRYFPDWERSLLKSKSDAYVFAKLNGHYGIVDQAEKEILPFVYDNITDKGDFFILTRNGKIGFFTVYSSSPLIDPAFDEFLSASSQSIKHDLGFTLFKIKNRRKTGYVGENGVAYFKD
jgi:hypothetical protein